jgi:ketosteroid isomerase-like protein
MEEALQRLLDEAAIKKVHIRYCRAIDRMDWELLRSCYHPDAVDDHGEYVGGIDGFVEYCKAGTPNFVGTTHFTGNQLVEVEGDSAWAEHHAVAYHRVAANAEGPERDLISIGRYVDRYERRGGEWRLSHRKVVVDYDRVDAVLGHWVPAIQLLGKRDRTDPSYEHLPRF